MRRPLLRIALVFLFGLVVGFHAPVPWFIPFVWMIGIWSAACLHPKTRDVLVCMALVLSGWAYSAVHSQLHSGHQAHPPAGPKSPAVSVLDRYTLWFQGCGERILSYDIPQSDSATDLIQALALGLRSRMDPDRNEQFRKSGCLHVFAISGLHIALIASMFFSILTVIRLPAEWACLVAGGCLWAYALGTGGQPSAIRATILFTLVFMGKILKQPGDFISSTAAAALFILWLDPDQLFDPGFQLSFTIVIALVAAMERLDGWIRSDTGKDPFALKHHRPLLLRARSYVRRVLLGGLTVSVVAFLASFPLTLFWFGGASPGGIVGNLLVVPLTYLILASGLGSVLFSWLPFISSCFNHSAWFLMHVMIGVSGGIADMDSAFFTSTPPSIASLALYYTAMFTLLFHSRPSVAVSVSMALALVVAVFWMLSPFPGTEIETGRLTVFPCRGGDAILFDPPGTKDEILIDCATEYEAVYQLTRRLRLKGIEDLYGLALTHGDVAHVSGTRIIVDQLRPTRCWIPAYPFRSKPYRNAVAYLESSRVTLKQVSDGASFSGLKVLFPLQETSHVNVADDGVMVLQLEQAGWKVLLVSDLSPAGQNVLCNRFLGELRSDVVITGLPSEGEPLVGPLLDWIDPRVILVSSGLEPATAKCPLEIRERLSLRCGSVWFTETEGAIDLTLEPSRLSVSSEDGRIQVFLKNDLEMN